MARSRAAILSVLLLAAAAFCALQEAFVAPKGVTTSASRSLVQRQAFEPERYWGDVPEGKQWWMADQSYVLGFTMIFFVCQGLNILGFWH